jgi:uncharacterized protein (TIGR00251 family)
MTSGAWVRATPDGVVILVKVIPRAGATKFAGLRDGRLLIRLAAPPVDGAANDELIALLSKALGVPARGIAVISGAHSRTKQIAIAGVGIDRAVQALTSRNR